MRRAGALVAALALAGCGQGHTSSGSASAGSAAIAAPDPLAPLHAFEEERRRAADFAHLPPSDRALGPDPIAIRAVPGSKPPRFVGLLRGRDAVVLLDASLHELARAPAPALPTGLHVAEDGEVTVSGEQGHDGALWAYWIERDGFRGGKGFPQRAFAHGLRDAALGRSRGGRVAYAVDEREGRLLAMSLGETRGGTKILPACAGAFRVAAAGEHLVVDCLLDHALAIYDLDRDAMPGDTPRAVLRHDGPIWGFDAVPTRRGLLVAAGGVEDHPLDRTEGSFGFIDSFVFLYLVPPAGDPQRLAAVNVSEHGVVTPKAIVLQAGRDGGATVLAAGYGSDRLAEITWPGDLHAPPSVTTRTILPGAASMALAGDLLVFADPLLDAWFSLPLAPATIPVPVPVPAPLALPISLPVPADPPPVPVAVPDPGVTSTRSAASRVGEALFFTNLMAPWNRSEGRLSRFTCETCHFEGYVDGRTHHTGRGDVRATTKPLLGLFNNRPHFSRALDPDLAVMSHAEFRAAGAKSDHDPWFSAAEAPIRWTPLLGALPEDLDALGLRRSLMAFFMDFTHRPNPAVLGRARFDAKERRGAEVFRDRGCEGCHEARLSADDPGTRVPFERWEELVMTREGPIVWGSEGYRKTGVEPYVHDQGARTPSLRRLYKKRPYFTNGSAKTLRDALERVRIRGDETWHDRAPDGASGLPAGDVEALLAFLDLL